MDLAWIDELMHKLCQRGLTEAGWDAPFFMQINHKMFTHHKQWDNENDPVGQGWHAAPLLSIDHTGYGPPHTK